MKRKQMAVRVYRYSREELFRIGVLSLVAWSLLICFCQHLNS